MIFQYTLPHIIDGRKTQTRRIKGINDTAIRDKSGDIISVQVNGRTKWQVGKTYAIQPGRTLPAIGRIRITQIREEAVQNINQEDAIAEGYDSRETFFAVWRDVHGERAMDVEIWAISFEVDSLDESAYKIIAK